ncbi:MAG: DEAD/DEAH box helicase, partial [Saprospiraceae bacterium]
LKKGDERLFIGIPKEITYQENRVPLTPAAVELLVNNGHEIIIESKTGKNANFFDKDYSDVGAKIAYEKEEVYKAKNSFADFKLDSRLSKTVESMGIITPSPIQDQIIPEILKGKDILGVAQTGSGKTLSFVLPLLMKVAKNKTYNNRHIKALILAPTRELAIQVHQVVQLFAGSMERRIKSMAIYGGVSINPQMIGLQNVEILVATPGRLLDLAEKKALHFSDVETFVLDEADKLLNLGFKKEINEVLGLLPAKRQNLLFSATLSEEVKKIQNLLLDNPRVISIKAEETRTDLIKQVAYKVSEEQKGPFLRYLIKKQGLEQVLVFTSSGKNADKIAKKLEKNGISARSIHGKLSQGARMSTLYDFKDKELDVLVATDLLSRGIDIDALPCVINYELPRSPKDYIHRIGRTGRAGTPGLAISILTEDDLHHFKVTMKKGGFGVDVQGIEDVDLHGY